MKTIFIHGLHSGKESIKFKAIKKHYPDAEIFEWSADEKDIHKRLIELANSIDPGEDILLIGDSTGANFALQLRYFLASSNNWAKLVLISPLLWTGQLIDKKLIPQNIKDQLVDFERFEDSLLFIPSNDTVIDHQQIPVAVTLNTKRIILHGNTHKAESFPLCMEEIVDYAKSISL